MSLKCQFRKLEFNLVIATYIFLLLDTCRLETVRLFMKPSSYARVFMIIRSLQGIVGGLDRVLGLSLITPETGLVKFNRSSQLCCDNAARLIFAAPRASTWCCFCQACLSRRWARFALLKFGIWCARITRVVMVGVGRDNGWNYGDAHFSAIYPLGDYSITSSGIRYRSKFFFQSSAWY